MGKLNIHKLLIQEMLYSLKVPTKSVNCSTEGLLSACPTCKMHKDLNQMVVKTTALDIMSHRTKTSSNATIKLFTFWAIALSYIKCLYNFSSSFI
jgi:hypothetical protein